MKKNVYCENTYSIFFNITWLKTFKIRTIQSAQLTIDQSSLLDKRTWDTSVKAKSIFFMYLRLYLSKEKIIAKNSKAFSGFERQQDSF